MPFTALHESRVRLSRVLLFTMIVSHRAEKQLYIELEVVKSIPYPGTSTDMGPDSVKKMVMRVLYTPETSASIVTQADVASSRARGIDSTADVSEQTATTTVLEEVDLAQYKICHSLFASISVHTPPGQQPLKAVYRGPVVGLRYLYLHHLGPSPHSNPSSSNPRSKAKSKDKTGAEAEFKRLQVRFQSAEEATQFLLVISEVCPTKLSAEPPGTSSTPTVASTTVTAQGSQHVPAAASATPSTSTSGPEPPSMATRSITTTTAAVPILQPSLSHALPHLTQSLTSTGQGDGEPRGTRMENVASARQLAQEMGEDVFMALVRDVLQEDGFDELVERVQKCLKQQKVLEELC